MTMSLVHADRRGRLSLGKLIQAGRDYRVSTSPHGTVVLEPVTVISDYERRVLENPQLVAALDKALETPEDQYVSREVLPRRQS